MAIQKQSLNINFSQGLDTKTDPFQVSPGKFLQLENSVFTKGGLLQKRGGYGPLVALPTSDSTYLSTFNDNLLAISNRLQALSLASNEWVDKGYIQPLNLSVLPLIRSNTNQSQVDSVVAENGLICTVYTNTYPTVSYNYAIADSITGQNIVPPTVIAPVSGTITNSPRVFLLGRYFIIVYTNLDTINKLKYIAIDTSHPTMVTPEAEITNNYVPTTNLSFDGFVTNSSLYLAWAANDPGGSVRVRRLTSSLVQSNTIRFNGSLASIMSVTADESGVTPIIYASFYHFGSNTGKTLAVDVNLNVVLAPTLITNNTAVINVAIVADSGICTIFYEYTNAYVYDGAIPTNFIKKASVTQTGTVVPPAVLVRSVGLASKAFLLNDSMYFLSVYNSVFQPSYFLINSNGLVVSKLAYSNAGPYYTTGLPNVSLSNTNGLFIDTVRIPYLFKSQIQAVNKAQGSGNPAGIYSQLGLNLATFVLDGTIIASAEIGSNLSIPSGTLWAYDGYQIAENGFFVWPDDVEATPSASGGSMSAQQYFYVATYEWADNQGNVFRSAPSIPVEATTTTGVSSVTVDVPTLRLTYKTQNPVKLVLYRWSAAQQVYYQTTSIAMPILNNLAVDYIAITDTNADADILGNNILYTTGGVLENISPPAADSLTLFQSRLFLIDSEDKNLLWFSKQVIENTPVEMSDLLTIFVAPTTSAQVNTGPLRALAPLDDKLILFKKDSTYYINGVGPDNTGANSQFSEPVFITSTVGSNNQKSIVFMPKGLMFQSDKGIWLLGRDLSTFYIGAPVEALTQGATVLSALNVPGTNQVRFTLDTGITLMYDYYYDQWGTFTNVPAISSTLYNGLHTYLNSTGKVFQETPNLYLDNLNPVLMNFTTSWLNLAGLQGYERAYFFYLLGSYITPHKLNVSIAYDYNPSPTQTTIIAPTNFNAAWGGLPQWGSSPSWGGSPSLEQWRVFLKTQKCQSFRISIQEYYDATLGAPAGAGLTISGLDIVVGVKSGYPRLRAANSVG